MRRRRGRALRACNRIKRSIRCNPHDTPEHPLGYCLFRSLVVADSPAARCPHNASSRAAGAFCRTTEGGLSKRASGGLARPAGHDGVCVGIYPCPQHRQTYSASAARARLWSGLIFFGDGSAGYAAYLWASIRSISGLRASFAETQYPCGFWPFGGSIDGPSRRDIARLTPCLNY